jgi:hypothetical protein
MSAPKILALATTLKFPSGKVNSFHSAWANVVARNNETYGNLRCTTDVGDR